MNLFRTSLAVLAGFTGGLFVASAPTSDIDLTKYPAPPSKVHADLARAQTKLADAVAAATQEIEGGLVSKAEVGSNNDVSVTVVTESAVRTLVIGAADGAIKSNVDSTATLPGVDVTGEPTWTESGLGYFDIVVGDGAQPTPQSTVEVHYTGWLVNGHKFDSSVDRGKSIEFGLSQVIKGWTEGVGSMKVGGKRKLLIPHTLGYGERSVGTIPSRAFLVFDVELLGVK